MNAPHDSSIDDLLREVGPRVQVSADIIATVRAAVIGEWRAMLERRQRRNQRYALAAGIVAVLSIAAFGLRIRDKPTVVMGTVVRIDGILNVAGSHGAVHAAHVGEALLSGTELATEHDSYVALDFGDGIGLRLAKDSTLRLSAPGQVVLAAGALYVDSGIANEGTRLIPLTVQTSAGRIHHIGTQYQVRTLTGPAETRGIEVSIRQGQVQIETAGQTSTGSAGERLSISSQGQVARTSLSPLDPSWQWAARAAPQFDIGGHSLHEFLRWAAHETGRKLTYASPACQSAAEALKLGGSIAGLDPDTALEAILSTTKLQSSKPTPDTLRITLQRD
jgi:ferric-dicitrate binding protein FerR (iron transport regulator)